MTATIPRALVADAFGVDAASLPPGDLPLDRLAARFLNYRRAGDEEAPPPADHPDAWTFSLMDDLTRDHPALGLAATVAALKACEGPEDVAMIAAGPLEDLIAAHGAALIDTIERRARQAPRFRYALTGVCPRGEGRTLLWARVKALQTGPQLDADDPLPPEDGLD